MYSYFVFNGIDSRDMGVYLAAPALIQRGRERVTEVTVLGCAGTLTLTEGEDVYEPYTQQLVLRAREPVHGVNRWLRGEGFVTFSGEPDLKQLARVVTQYQFKKVSHHIPYWEGAVQFVCQPLKQLLYEKRQAVVSGQRITNAGDVTERPTIILTGAYGDIDVAVGDNEPLHIEGLDQSAGGCVIDCAAMALLNIDKTELLTKLTTGDFPALPVGRSTITISGSHTGSAVIARAERWL